MKSQLRSCVPTALAPAIVTTISISLLAVGNREVSSVRPKLKSGEKERMPLGPYAGALTFQFAREDHVVLA